MSAPIPTAFDAGKDGGRAQDVGRQLHLLFEPSGTSLAQHVPKRRLEECRAALMNPIGDRSVTDIALAWGFNSMWTFNRNFRQAFGAAPGEMRARAAAGVSPAPMD